MKITLNHDHWPQNETVSGLAEAEANERREIRGVLHDRAVEVGAWCLVALFLAVCWAGLVAAINYLSK